MGYKGHLRHCRLFLSKTASRNQLPAILSELLTSLNSKRAEANLVLDEANPLNLKLFKAPKPLTLPVPDYIVPVLLRPEWQIQMFDWDLLFICFQSVQASLRGAGAHTNDHCVTGCPRLPRRGAHVTGMPAMVDRR